MSQNPFDQQRSDIERQCLHELSRDLQFHICCDNPSALKKKVNTSLIEMYHCGAKAGELKVYQNFNPKIRLVCDWKSWTVKFLNYITGFFSGLAFVCVLALFFLPGCAPNNSTAEMYSGSADQFDYKRIRVEDRKNSATFEVDR